MGIKKLFVLTFSLIAAGCAAAPSDTLNINVNCGREYKAIANQPIEVHFGAWGALGEELVADNAGHLTVLLELDGRPVDSVREPVMACEDVTRYLCQVSQDYCDDGSFWIIHRATLDPLAPGEYEITVTQTFDEAITDGYDSNEDGVADTYGPGQWAIRSYTIEAK